MRGYRKGEPDKKQKAEIPGEGLEPDPASPWWAEKESLTGLCRQESAGRMEAGYR